MPAFTSILSPGAEARLDVATSTVDRPSCVLRDLFLVFLIGDREQTLEARPSLFLHPAMSQARVSGVGTCWCWGNDGQGEEDDDDDDDRPVWLGLDNVDFEYCVHALVSLRRLALRVQTPYFGQQHTLSIFADTADTKYVDDLVQCESVRSGGAPCRELYGLSEAIGPAVARRSIENIVLFYIPLDS
ncbi:hypothetical protein K438DRAFT_2029666 [Mycena galopus ATCC 62051]|nr:hypothetical protein K438DRAFT_2029666 [Mycena galopus ATCC 62051]